MGKRLVVVLRGWGMRSHTDPCPFLLPDMLTRLNDSCTQRMVITLQSKVVELVTRGQKARRHRQRNGGSLHQHQVTTKCCLLREIV